MSNRVCQKNVRQRREKVKCVTQFPRIPNNKRCLRLGRATRRCDLYWSFSGINWNRNPLRKYPTYSRSIIFLHSIHFVSFHALVYEAHAIQFEWEEPGWVLNLGVRFVVEFTKIRKVMDLLMLSLVNLLDKLVKITMAGTKKTQSDKTPF